VERKTVWAEGQIRATRGVIWTSWAPDDFSRSCETLIATIHYSDEPKNDKGEWQNTDYYFPEELPKLESVVRKSFDFILVKESKEAEESIPV